MFSIVRSSKNFSWSSNRNDISVLKRKNLVSASRNTLHVVVGHYNRHAFSVEIFNYVEDFLAAEWVKLCCTFIEHEYLWIENQR